MAALEELVLELTDQCPQRCLHCSSNSGPTEHAELRPSVATRLVTEASELGARKLSLGGGEPTASPLFLEILHKANNRGLAVEIFTCGVTQEDTPWPRELIDEVRHLHPLKAIFSVHGPDEETHDGITQKPGSFCTMAESLTRCVEAGIHCETNFVPLKLNFCHFREVVELSAARGAKRLSVLRFVPQGRGLQNRVGLELSREQENMFLSDLQEYRRRAPIDIRTGSPFNGIVPGEPVPCRAGTEKLVVQADGNVLPCEVFKHATVREWGLSVYERSLREILSSPNLLPLRNLLRHGNCITCPVHSMLRTLQMRGDTDATERRQVPKSAVHV